MMSLFGFKRFFLHSILHIIRFYGKVRLMKDDFVSNKPLDEANIDLSSTFELDRVENAVKNGQNIDFSHPNKVNLKVKDPSTTQTQKSMEKSPPRDFGDLISRFEANERASLPNNGLEDQFLTIVRLRDRIKQKDKIISQLQEEKELYWARYLQLEKIEESYLDYKQTIENQRCLIVEFQQIIDKLRAELAEKDKILSKFCSGSNPPPLSPQNSSVPPSKGFICQLLSGSKGEALPSEDENREKEDDNTKPKRKQGAQPGHERHTREMLTEETATEVQTYDIKDGICPHCGDNMTRVPEKDIQRDTVELGELIINSTMHKISAYWCPKCRKYHYGGIPTRLSKYGIFGPTLLVIMVFFRIRTGLSLRKIKDLLCKIFRVEISLGQLDKEILTISQKLAPIFLEIREQIRIQPVLYIDETGSKIKGKRNYLWFFESPTLKFFTFGSRKSVILEGILGDDYSGTISSDHYQVYISYVNNHPKAKLQICHAHLKRDIQRLTEYNDPCVREYGKKLQQIQYELFGVYHERLEAIKNGSDYSSLTAVLHEIAKKFTKAALENVPNENKSKALAERFVKHPQYYFTFIDNIDVEITNNIAERGVRQFVIYRATSFGTQSHDGNFVCAVLRTILDTATKQGVNVVQFIENALSAHENGQGLPSLVNIGEEVDQKFYDMADKEWAKLIKQKEEDEADKEKLAELKQLKKQGKEPDSKPLQPEQKNPEEPDSKPLRPKVKKGKDAAPKSSRCKPVAGKTRQKCKAHKKKTIKLRPNRAVPKTKTGKVRLKLDLPEKTFTLTSGKDKTKLPPFPPKRPLDTKLKVSEPPSTPAFRWPGKRHLKAPGSCRSAKSGACPVGSHSLPSNTPPYFRSKSSTRKILA
jgi:transposase